ncbi:histone-lysine N-methyltransferase SETMAR [Trichonephila clavata]|uniref:Histone-lysine N-methyltransferase SETMAR n=1 Tax=Trichonephila clavata TaxID=2740835 RepID=A0A8X6KY43_TRICU|nr:histone-lysine N-methyltransferase SETMAR [Trichonephila clavata]
MGTLGYRKFCARWVPKMLTEIHKTSPMGADLEFLSRYHMDGEDFLNRIVTGDETLVAHVIVETKQQCVTWGHTSSPTRLRKVHQTLHRLQCAFCFSSNDSNEHSTQ